MSFLPICQTLIRRQDIRLIIKLRLWAIEIGEVKAVKNVKALEDITFIIELDIVNTYFL